MLSACTLPTNSATPEKSEGTLVTVMNERVFGQCPSPSQEPLATLYAERDWQQERALPELSQTRKIDWPVDFATDSVVRYSMGTKPSLGYGVKRDGPIRVRDNVAVVTVSETAPAPGAIVATALTTPCLYVQIEAAGLTGVRVIDSDGNVLAESR